MGQQNTKSTLFLKLTLGQTQSHELFDFQTSGHHTEHQLIHTPSFIVDKGETVDFVAQDQTLLSKDLLPEQAIYKVTLDDYQQITIKDLVAHETRDLWKVIKPGECQPIKPGDMLKIGKIKLQLKKVVDKRQEHHYDQQTVKDINQSLSDDAQSLHSGHSSMDRCRICFSSHSKQNNPLLCLCKCSGSIKWVHFLCQKDWITNTLSKRQDEYCKFYTYNETACELCKHALPNQFTHEGKAYSFLDFSKFEPPYAEFEYNQIENGKKKYYKYVINLQKDKEVAIGRNNASQVIMKDISISRTHCSLQYKHGMLLVRDKKSKFGTLIKVDKTIEFNSENGLQLQFDSKLIELYNKNTFKTCCSDVDSYKLIYDQSDDLPRTNRFASVSNHENYSADTRQVHGMSAGEPNFEIMRMESAMHSEHQSSSHGIEEGLEMEENLESPSRRPGRGAMVRETMIRETIARDEAIRY